MTVTGSVPEAAERPAGKPWTERRVIAYAHQGGAWEAPSSTLYAVRRAIEMGATGIELDVHATADRKLVVCHDGTVDRTTNGSGVIAEMTWDELSQLDNAYWWVPGADVTHGLDESAYPFRGWGPADPSYGIARLEDVLDLLEDHPDVALNLDIKATSPTVAPYEELLAKALYRAGHLERIIVASFLDVATFTFSKFAPDIATSAGTVAVAEFWRAVHQGHEVPAMSHCALQVPASRGDLVVVDDLLVEAAHRAGLAVHVWTVNEPKEMARLLDLGVDGIITDLPSVLVELLEDRGLTYRP